MDKRVLRGSIFRHLDGIVLAPVVTVLNKRRIIDELLQVRETDISELSTKFAANEGYLNVALRVLAAQGFLEHDVDNKVNKVSVKVNKNTAHLITYQEVYEDLNELLSANATINNEDITDKICEDWLVVFEKYKAMLSADHSNDAIKFQVQKHIEGCLIGPITVRLGMSGMFHNYFMQSSFSADEFHKNPAYFGKILKALTSLGWFYEKDGYFEFTDLGLFYAKRASAYGVTVSYLPMFARLEEMLFGDPGKIRSQAEGEDEHHVNRQMNVWGSGGAHSSYFKVIDELIIEIFNRPIAEQPKGILDMGCGNGALLQHLYEVIERSTLRGKMLESHPLFLVGADYNQAALKVTRANLVKNDIWAKVIWGDIGDPEALAQDLSEKYKIPLGDLLNMRSFLDHNRTWQEPATEDANISTSTGAFAHRGVRLANNAVESSLKEHLQKWKPYVKKYGLLLIELHTIPPSLTAKNLGNTPATAYDATHGFSDQFVLEMEVFHNVCRAVGLRPEMDMFERFPDSDLATVSISLLKQDQNDM